jgi:CheY-like chemotaxis protein
LKGKIVEHIYKKIDNIDEKVKEANMPYMQWKVLFLVGENANAEEISSLIEEDVSDVEEILISLESKALIEKVDETKSDANAEKQAEDTTISSIGDELLMEEEIMVSEEEDVVPDSNEEFSLESDEKEEEESFLFDEPTLEQDTAPLDIPISEKPDFSEKSSDSDSFGMMEDEFDLSINEPEAAVADQPETNVTFEEPVKQKPADTESLDEEIISDGTSKTVMVIDDSIVIRKMIEIALEEEDIRIVTAISGKEGLEMIEKDMPNLVILDMMLPDMNGIEVLKKIKSDYKLPVIMLSGKDSPQLIEMAKEVGVNDFLPKPFRDEELVEKVKTLIEV